MPFVQDLGKLSCVITDIDGCCSLVDTTCSQAVAITQVLDKVKFDFRKQNGLSQHAAMETY